MFANSAGKALNLNSLYYREMREVLQKGWGGVGGDGMVSVVGLAST
jgi:hypothetical protein